jgi:hypothetical protein
MTATNPLCCSFCGKPAPQIRKLIAGPGVYICNECVDLCIDILANEDISAQPRIPEWETMTDDQILEKLPRIAAAGAQVEASLRAGVGRLRGNGVTWSRIGTALGTTRQSAWERFAAED